METIRFLLAILITGLINLSVFGQLEGKYLSIEPSIVEKTKMVLFGNHYIGGNELILKSDSTYSFLTCSTFAKGKWKIVGDSLMMFSDTINWRIDSINKDNSYYRKILSVRKSVFKVENNKFYREILGKENNDTILLIDILKKE